MDDPTDIGKQLEQLHNAIMTLGDTVENAWYVYRASKNPVDKEKYNALLEEEKTVWSKRSALLDRLIGTVGEKVNKLLLDAYSVDFNRAGPASNPGMRTSNIEAAYDAAGQRIVQGLGRHIPLLGMDKVVKQVAWGLRRMSSGYYEGQRNDNNFWNSLQLLRLIAAPGSGKSTALLECWPQLYAQADQLFGASTSLLERIRNSLGPNPNMVFSLDFAKQGLDTVYKALEGDELSSRPLALRMLFSSLRPEIRAAGYKSFLENMPHILRRQLQPEHVVQFWEDAAGLAGRPWMFVLGIDGINAIQAAAEPEQPDWMQWLLSDFVGLRQLMQMGCNDCFPVIFVASTKIGTCSMRQTVSQYSGVKDVILPLIASKDAESALLDVARRMYPGQPVPGKLPNKLKVLLDLSGGIPRLVVWSVLAAQERRDCAPELLPFPEAMEDCKWLTGDFDLDSAVDSLVEGMMRQSWQKWLDPSPANCDLLSKAVGYCITQEPVCRFGKVPGSQSVAWEDMEEDAVLSYGQGVDSTRLGDASSVGAVTGGEQHADATKARKEEAEELEEQSRSWEQPIRIAPLLLIAAYKQFSGSQESMPYVPLMRHLTNEWQQPEIDAMGLVLLKLFFYSKVLKRQIVPHSKLLVHAPYADDCCVFVPENTEFRVEHISYEMGQAEMEELVRAFEAAPELERRFAFVGPGKEGPNSWLILERVRARLAETRFEVLCLHSKMDTAKQPRIQGNEQQQERQCSQDNIEECEASNSRVEHALASPPLKKPKLHSQQPNAMKMPARHQSEFYTWHSSTINEAIRNNVEPSSAASHRDIAFAMDLVSAIMGSWSTADEA